MTSCFIRYARPILVPPEQIPRVHLVRDVGEVVAPAVGHDHAAAGLEALEVARDLGAEEVGGVERGLVHHDGDALGLHALHDALDGARAEVVGVALHGEPVDAHHRRGLAGVDERHHAVDHRVRDVVLARAVRVDDGADEVLRDVAVVGEQLLGVLGQAVAAVAEAGVVVVGPDAGLEAHPADDVGGGEPLLLAVGVELVEVGHAQGEVGVGEELHRLGLRAAEHEPGDADRAVRVPAGALGGVRAFLEQRREPLGGGAGAGVALGRPHHYAAGVQVVVQGPALAEELRGEDDPPVAQAIAQRRGVADGNRRLDDDPGARVDPAHRLYRRLDAGGVEEVAVGVVVGRCRDHDVLGAGVGLRRVDRGAQEKRPLPRLGLRQEPLDLAVLDGRLEAVDLLHLLGDDVQGADLVVLGHQHGDGQADVTGARYCNFH